MNENQIISFIEAARENSFTKAGQNTFQSQPAISRTISSLEKELGSPLFIRKKNKKIALTEEGEIYYRAFLDMQKSFLEAKKACDLLKSHASYRLRIGYPTGWTASNFIPKILSSLNKEYPNITISLVCYEFGELCQQISNGALDLALTLDNQLVSHYHLQKINVFQIPKVILYSSLFNNCKGVTSISDFKDATFLMHSNELSNKIKDELVSYCKPYGFYPTIKIVPNLDTIFSMVESNLGVSILDTWIQPISMPQFRYLELPEKHNVVLTYSEEFEHKEILEFISSLLTNQLANS